MTEFQIEKITYVKERNDGDVSEWNREKFGEIWISHKSMKHELGSMQEFCLLSDCILTSWSLTKEVAGTNNLFYKTFVTEFIEFNENI